MVGSQDPQMGPLPLTAPCELFFQMTLLVPDGPMTQKEKSIYPVVVYALEKAQALGSDGPDLYHVILGKSLNLSECSLCCSWAPVPTT